ncbi:hypothetical protein I1300191J6_30430 [Parabacteroides distasonis]|jgi:hypothetical protein|uniref:hypothetical protein n=1 Tax=Parabacteroides distasonis TaxID=823 RepID=UPI0034B94E46
MMRRYTLYNQLMAVAAGLCLCWLCVACGEDRGGDLPNDDPNSCVVTITLRTSRSARPPQTKAGETITWEDDDEYERDITDWLVVAYDDENAELAGYTSSEGTWTPDINDPDPDSRTEVEMRLPLGKYSFYAFANLQSLEDGTSLYQKITGAHSLAELSEVKILDSGTSIDTRNEEKKGKFGGEEASRKRIPMSSYAQKHTVLPVPAENKFEIPLIRMIGKVQVEITNNLDKSITVNRLDIMNLRKGSLPIWLLPWGNENYLEFKDDKDLEEPLVPSFPKDANPSVVSLEDLYTESIKPGDNEKEIQAKPVDGENGSKRAYIRYIPETNAAVGENGSGIHLGVEIEGRPRTEHLTGFDFVRRNDLLVIPVLITNITTKLEVAEQRLPIGVYPTALVYGEKTGVQILTPVEHTLQAAGDLSIRFEISRIEGVTGDFTIKGLPQDETVPETVKFSSIQVKDDDKHLITAVNGEDCDKKQRFYLPEASVKEGKKGSFTIHTQELGGKAEATVILTLIINYYVDQEKQEMQIPYTIKIRNYKQ